MRKLFFIGCFLFCCSMAGQGTQAAEIAVSIFTSTLPETQSLIAIRKDQEFVLEVSKEIAQKSAAILVLKEAELLALTQSPERLQATSSWRDSYTLMENIIQMNASSLSMIDNFPDIEQIPLESILTITEQTYTYIQDIERIYEGGDDNMMKPTDRYELIERINKGLIRLYEFSAMTNNLIRVNILTSGNIPIEEINFSTPLNETLDDIENLIQE